VYDTINGIFFQVNFLSETAKYCVFSIETGVLEKLIRILAFIGLGCYNPADIRAFLARELP